jgi:hypothetical protein
MATESAGSVYAEIRIELDKLQGDISKMNQLFVKAGQNIDKQTSLTKTKTQQLTSSVTKNFQEMSKSGINQFAKMASGIQSTIMALPIVGFITMIIGAITKMISGIGEFINKTSDAYTNQQKELAGLKAIIESTGASSWTTTGQLQNMAKVISKETGKSINDITKMQGRLLTYTNIMGENFNRTQQAAVNMAAVMRMDLSNAVETLGKALDSPIEGLTALTRQGFRFSDQLKAQIKDLVEAGKVSQAQALILKEVENVYSGVASAMGKAEGNSAKLINVTEELNAELGKSTSKFTEWWKGIQLANKEMQLMLVRQMNLATEVKTTEKTIFEFNEQIKKLEAQMRETGDPTGELTNKINSLQVARNAADNIDHLSNKIEELQLNLALMKGAGKEDPIANFIRHLNPLNAIKDMILAIKLLMGDSVEEMEKKVKRMEREREILYEINNLNAKRNELENAISKDNLEFKNQLNVINEASIKRQKIISDTYAQEAAGLIDFEEGQKRRQAAYREEATTIFNTGRTLEEMQEKLAVTRTEQIADIKAVTLAANQELYKLINEGLKTAEEVMPLIIANNTKMNSMIAEINTRYNQQTDAIAEANAKRQEALKQEQIINNQRLRAAAEENAAKEKQTNSNNLRKQQLQDIINLQSTSNANRIKASNDLLNFEKEIAVNELKRQDYYKNLTAGLSAGTKEYQAAVNLQNKLIEQTKTLIDMKVSTEIQAQNEIYDKQKEIKLLEAERIGDITTILELERQMALEKLRQSDIYLHATKATREQLEAQIGLIEKSKAINEYAKFQIDQQREIELLEAERVGDLSKILEIEKQIELEKLKQTDKYKYGTEAVREQLEAQIGIIEQTKAINDFTKHEIDQQREIELLEAERTGDLSKILEIERQIALEKLKQTDMYKYSTEEVKNQLEAEIGLIEHAKAINDYTKFKIDQEQQIELLTAKNKNDKKEIKRIELEIAKANLMQNDWYKELDDIQKEEIIKNLERIYDLQNAKDPFEDYIQGLNLLSQAISAVGNLMSALTKKQIDEELSQLEKRYKYEQELMEDTNKRKLELLEEDYQNKLYYAGLGKATTEEHFEEDLQKAIASGNHRLMYRASQAKKEFEIRKDYEEKVKEEEKRQQKEKEEAEKQYQFNKSQIEYKAALQQWGVQLALTTASVAQAIMQSFGQLGPIAGAVGAALMAALGAVQIGAVIAAKPTPPKMETGGILRGDPYRGDSTPVMARGREAFLTEDDQRELFGMIRGGNSGQSIIINSIIELDGEIIAEKVFEVGSLGNAFIRQRGVVR